MVLFKFLTWPGAAAVITATGMEPGGLLKALHYP